MAKYANGSSNLCILWSLIELSCIYNQFRFWFCKVEIVILWHSMPVQIKVIACSQVRRAVRATLILFPLLGMTNLLFFINPKVSFASYPTFFILVLPFLFIPFINFLPILLSIINLSPLFNFENSSAYPESWTFSDSEHPRAPVHIHGCQLGP